jgi:hypothetical protein
MLQLNTIIEYQYRDACNYKKYNSVIINGKLILEDIYPFLHDGDFFIPSVVGLKDLQNEPFTIDDHIWHEIVEISETSLKSNIAITAKSLLKCFKDAKQNNWNEYEVYERKGLV